MSEEENLGSQTNSIPSNDLSAVREMLKNLQSDIRDVRSKTEKIDELAEHKNTSKDEDEFLTELYKDPKSAIKKLIYQETEPIKKKVDKAETEIFGISLRESDRVLFDSLKSIHPDYDEVMADSSKYVEQSDFDELKGSPKRAEMLFSLIKTRRDAALSKVKAKEKEANQVAKDLINKNAVSANPSNVNQVPNNMVQNNDGISDFAKDARDKIKTSRENFDSKAITDILTEDIWHEVFEKR